MLEDNLRIPSGASYPLFVRDIERHADPRLFREHDIRDNRDAKIDIGLFTGAGVSQTQWVNASVHEVGA